MHLRGVELARVLARAASSSNGDKHVVMVQNMFLSCDHAGLLATVTNTEGEREGTLGGTLGNRREDCSVLTLNLKLVLRTVSEENASLATAVNSLKGRVKILEKKVKMEYLNGMPLLRELKQ